MDLNKDLVVSWEEIMTADVLNLVLHYPHVLLDMQADELDELIGAIRNEEEQEEEMGEEYEEVVEEYNEYNEDHDEL